MRSRRLASFALDLFFVTGPWAGLAGFAVGADTPSGMGGVGIVIVLVGAASLATITVLVVQAALFASRGRTLGMACVGIAAQGGSRGLALFLNVLLVVVPCGIVLVLSRSMQGDTVKVVLPLAPAAGLAVDALFALGPSARTLIDRASGALIASEPRAAGAPRVGGLAVDALLLAATGASTPLVLDWTDFAPAVIGSGCAVLVLAVVEIVLVVKAAASIGMRALAPAAQRGR